MVSPILAQEPPFTSPWNVSLGMACKRMFASGRGAAPHARPPRCIATTKHLLKPLMSPMHVSTMCISIWSVSFLHHEGTVSSLLVWIASLDGVKPSHWSPSCRTGLLDLAHQSLSQPTTVPSLNQRFSPNYVNSWVASSSEQLHITQPPTQW